MRTKKVKLWSKRQVDYLRRHYATQPTQDIAERLHRSVKSIYGKAKELGLSKDPSYFSELGTRLCQHPNSAFYRFKPGHQPANKGKRVEQFMSAGGMARFRANQFKPGNQPHNTKPVGYERACKKDGYIYLKVADGQPMQLKHRYVWQQHYGEIPEGMIVVFRDGDHTNCDISNLELISREESARRRTREETAEQRASRIAKATATRNKSIRRDRVRIHWGLEPKTKLVKRW